jgi:hypothetical protein
MHLRAPSPEVRRRDSAYRLRPAGRARERHRINRPARGRMIQMEVWGLSPLTVVTKRALSGANRISITVSCEAGAS